MIFFLSPCVCMVGSVLVGGGSGAGVDFVRACVLACCTDIFFLLLRA